MNIIVGFRCCNSSCQLSNIVVDDSVQNFEKLSSVFLSFNLISYIGFEYEISYKLTRTKQARSSNRSALDSDPDNVI